MLFKCMYCGREYSPNEIKKVGIDMLCPEDGNKVEMIFHTNTDFVKYTTFRTMDLGSVFTEKFIEGPLSCINYAKELTSEDAFLFGMNVIKMYEHILGITNSDIIITPIRSKDDFEKFIDDMFKSMYEDESD